MSLIIKMDAIKTEEHLRKSIPYIMNEKKTGGLCFSNSGITSEQIVDTFFLTKQIHPTLGTRQGYHFKFSFSKDETIEAEQALLFVKDWVDEYLAENYDYACSVHEDREHMHMHLVFNSVSRKGGKYRYEKGDWENVIRPLTNCLAQKYHTGLLKEKNPALDYSTDYDKKKGNMTGRERVEQDMDECILLSKSYADFKNRMVRDFHYQLREGVSREHGIYLALTPPGRGKAIRTYRLSDGYMPVDIDRRINAKAGKSLLQKSGKRIQSASKLDERMNELARKKPDHPAVKAYQRYRGGPDDTIRSVIMTVNARMQPFDNEELLEIFSSNDIPLDEFGTGIDGDGKTKSNLFIIIPDDDDTFNFVPGMVYTMLFQELYRQARFFGGKLPMDVGFWLDEMANIKMPNNFDKILATCRSRGVYCVPILQSLAQLKTLFTDGAWEGIVGNCDTFIYLGGNEASTYEYVSKLLGKWTIDKRTSGESKGSSGSYSENYDVLGRELMLEYEIRLIPDDECIIFVRGENPIRDKKWFPWEHEEYLEARKCGAFVPAEQKKIQEKQMEECQFVGDASLAYLKKQKDKSENIQLYGMDAFAFMTMDLDEMEKKIHPVPDEKKVAPTITADMIQTAIEVEKRREEEEQKTRYLENFGQMSLLDIYSSDMTGSIRRTVIKELLQVGASDEVIKDIVHPKFSEDQVIQKKKMWMEMRGGL